MTPNEKLQLLAANTVHKVLNEGAKKPRPGCWSKEAPTMHLSKAIRHAMTAELIANGHQAPDGENHRELALTRFAMYLYTADL